MTKDEFERGSENRQRKTHLRFYEILKHDSSCLPRVIANIFPAGKGDSNHSSNWLLSESLVHTVTVSGSNKTLQEVFLLDNEYILYLG